LVFVAALSFGEEAATVKLSSAEHFTASSALLASKAMPKWSNGLFAIRDHADVPVPSVHLIDASGLVRRVTVLQLPDAARMIVTDVAVSPKGTLAVAGTAFANDGSTSSYILWVDSANKITQMARTSPYAATRICFTGDEVLWAAGREYTPDFETKAGSDIIRRYAPDGRLLGSSLPRSAVPTGGVSNPAANGFLVANNSQVVFYSARCRFWVALSLTGELMGSPHPVTQDIEATGLAITTSDSLYLSGNTKTDPKSFRLFHMDANSGKWAPVAIDGKQNVGGLLAGADGADLVLYTFRGTFLRVPTQ